MKITVEAEPKEIADLIVALQGQQVSIDDAVNDEVKITIYITKSTLRGLDGYCWAWKESFDKRIFGWTSSIENVCKKAKRMFPNKKLILEFF